MANDTWTGLGDGWKLDDPQNWSGGSVPGNGSTAVFISGTVSVGYGPPVGAASPSSANFAPAAISVGGGASVAFAPGTSGATFAVATLDIGDSATVTFSDSNLIARAVNNSGILDLSQALAIGASPQGGTPQQAIAWSAAHGFGSVALTAVIGENHPRLVATGTPFPGVVDSLGATDLGNDNAAVAVIPMVYSGDFQSYVSVPSFPGNGKTVDALTTPAGIFSASRPGPDWAPGFGASETPYSNLFAESIGTQTHQGYATLSISVPGAASTAAHGINHQGQIVGSYSDSSGHEYGFLDISGAYATIAVPGAASTSANGINDQGQIVGTFFDANGTQHGFLDSGGEITTIDVPGALDTGANAISDSGVVVGYDITPKASNDPNAVGPATNAIEDSGGHFTVVQTGVNDGFEGIRDAVATGINDNGVVVGTTALAPASEPYGWVDNNGTFTTLATPPDTMGAEADGINNKGQIIGSGGGAFITQDGVAHPISLPGQPGGINDAGQIVGTAGNVGFLADPTAGAAVPCFAHGTSILTVDGEIPVDRLQPGMQVRTADGATATICWIGRQTLTVTEATAPILIRAHAVEHGVPHRDLHLSPDHGVLIEDRLIPAHRLNNGASILQNMNVAGITYWHVELDRHAILEADGLPAESYLDTGNRQQFHAERGTRKAPAAIPANHAGTAREAALAAYAAQGCAPLHLDGPAVDAVHRRLMQRAMTLGWQTTSDPDLLITCGKTRLNLPEGGGRFRLPPDPRTVRIRSRCFVPAEMDRDRRDGRRLGVALVVRGDGTKLPETCYGDGWHSPEDGMAWRWTNGNALLLFDPLACPGALEIDVAAIGARYWCAPMLRRVIRHNQTMAPDAGTGALIEPRHNRVQARASCPPGSHGAYSRPPNGG
jgi:probable HAF family extracellular repeat protein